MHLRVSWELKRKKKKRKKKGGSFLNSVSSQFRGTLASNYHTRQRSSLIGCRLTINPIRSNPFCTAETSRVIYFRLGNIIHWILQQRCVKEAREKQESLLCRRIHSLRTSDSWCRKNQSLFWDWFLLDRNHFDGNFYQRVRYTAC